MSNIKRKKTQSDHKTPHRNPVTILPSKYKDTVRSHVNSVYVGTIIRIYDPSYSEEGQLATAHWVTDQGIFVTLHEEQRSDFVTLKYKTFVVDHRLVKPGAFRLYCRTGTDDIRSEERSKTINEVKQQNSRVLMNHVVMDYPTQLDRETYACSLFKLTCNCGFSKRVKNYTCSEFNKENAGQRYYGCEDKYSTSVHSCNFFVWEREIEHQAYEICDCGILCKRINISKQGLVPVYKFVCVNRNNKYHPGCNVFRD